MKRGSNGRFLPHPIKVGDVVVNLKEGFNPGFAHNRVYEVVATSLSKDQLGFQFTLDTAFVVVDDDGMCRLCNLNPIHKQFQNWEKVNVPKT